jgi:hypothetical protein
VKAQGKLYITLCLAHFIDDFGRAKKSIWRPITGHYFSVLNVPLKYRRTLVATKVISVTDVKTSIEDLLVQNEKEYDILKEGNNILM